MQRLMCPEPVEGHEKLSFRRHTQVEPERSDEKNFAPVGKLPKAHLLLYNEVAIFADLESQPLQAGQEFFNLESVRMYCVYSAATRLIGPK